MDAALATIAIEQGATLCTTDRDFARFDGLKWEIRSRRGKAGPAVGRLYWLDTGMNEAQLVATTIRSESPVVSGI